MFFISRETRLLYMMNFSGRLYEGGQPKHVPVVLRF